MAVLSSIPSSRAGVQGCLNRVCPNRVWPPLGQNAPWFLGRVHTMADLGRMSAPAPLHRLSTWRRWSSQWSRLERKIDAAGSKLAAVSETLSASETRSTSEPVPPHNTVGDAAETSPLRLLP